MNRITKKEWLLLSRYIDDDLSAKQRRWVEEKLQTDQAFREAHDRLVHTHMVLRSVSQRRIPRSYTLSQEMVAAKKPRRTVQLFWQYSSAAAALVAVISLVMQMTNLSLMQASEIGPQPEVFKQEAVVLEEQAATQESPPIIVWNPQAATGMGGGGGNEQLYQEQQVVPESSLEGYGIGGGAPAQQMEPTALDETANLDEEVPTPESELAALDQAVGMGGDEPPFVETTPTPIPTPTPDDALQAPLAEAIPLDEPAEVSPERITGESNPILGIAPEDERGVIDADEMQEEQRMVVEPSLTTQPGSVRIGNITIVAAVLSAISAIIAFSLRKKQR